jgi:tetratricopeptide (TPR) repeat protein
MNRVLLTVLCLATMLTLRPAPGHASELTAVQLHEQGLTMLRKADFSGALQSFAAAMKADPQTIEHRQMAMLVNRALSVRAMFEETVDQQRWVQIAGALRTFYYDYQIYDEAMKLDRTVYETLGTPAAAVALAETMLVTEHDRDALGVLTKQDPEQLGVHGASLLAVALARTEKVDAARRCLASIEVTNETDPRTLYYLAAANARLDQPAPAEAWLTKAFEMTPPSRLEWMRELTDQCKDFAAIRQSAEFRKVMLTKSKIAESGCSGGSSCGSCASASSCGSAATATSGCSGEESCDKDDQCSGDEKCEGGEGCTGDEKCSGDKANCDGCKESKG